MHLPKSVIALVFLIIEKTIFLSLLGLGVYFIYHGDVLSRFEKKRTNFLSYEESITELPTVVVGVVDTSGFCSSLTKHIKLGEDIKIWFRYRNQAGSFQDPIDLIFGENIIGNNSLILDIQDLLPHAKLSCGEKWKITPIVHSHGMLPLDYEFIFVFENTTKIPFCQMATQIMTKNSTVPCDSGYHDGDAGTVLAQFGAMTHVKVKISKMIHLQDIGNCRTRPYTEEFNEHFIQKLHEGCNRSCVQHEMYIKCPGLALSMDVMKMPKCLTEKDIECSNEKFQLTLNKIYEEACTTLNFRPTKQITNKAKAYEKPSEAILKISFEPSRVSVQEEYLVYDLVSLISTIGGTMGLFIGFSFTDFTATIIAFIKDRIERVLNVRRIKNRLVPQIETVEIVPEQTSIRNLERLVVNLKDTMTKSLSELEMRQSDEILELRNEIAQNRALIPQRKCQISSDSCCSHKKVRPEVG